MMLRVLICLMKFADDKNRYRTDSKCNELVAVNGSLNYSFA